MQDKIWIGSPTDIRKGAAAEEALKRVNDSRFWDPEFGVTSVSLERWKLAQRFEAEGWLKSWRTASFDRNDEHKRSFAGYKQVPQDLGDVIEIGCGPFTQLKTISQRRRLRTITLLDPLIEEYLKLPNCSYKGGRFMGRPAKLLYHPAEELKEVEKFDVAICINVLEHVRDAQLVLNALYRCLRPAGTIIFGERVYDDLDIHSLYDVGHPIRIKSKVLQDWLAKFSLLYRNDRRQLSIIGKKNERRN